MVFDGLFDFGDGEVGEVAVVAFLLPVDAEEVLVVVAVA